MADDLAAWLLEQIAADERRARRAQRHGGGSWTTYSKGYIETGQLGLAVIAEWNRDKEQPIAEAWANHIVMFDPVRVLAECDAKRRRIAHLTDRIEGWKAGRHDSEDRATAIEDLIDALKLETPPYADRDGYREAWRP